jgi:hypothetical protein
MNTNKTTQLKKWLTTRAGIALLAAATLSARAQTWQVLSPTSTFAPAGTGVSVLIDPFSTDPNTAGVLLGTSANPDKATIYRLTPDAGFNSFGWEAVEDSGGINDLRRLGYVQNDGTLDGTLYAVGQARVIVRNQNYGVWKVLKSQAGGGRGTWDTEETWGLNSKADALAWGFTSDAKGNAFVCGWAVANTTGDNNRHWIVRRKAPGGSFATVSDVKTTVNVGAAAEAMCAVPGDGISPTVVFAVGHVGYKWNVMRSQQSGAVGTWFPAGASTWPAKRSLSVATDAACDSFGNVYVAGYYDGGYALGCIVQKSSDGGNSWDTLLDNNSDLPTGIWRLAIDPEGGVTLAGSIRDRDGTNSRWTIVRPVDPQSSTSWQTAYANPLVHPFAGTGNHARGIAADPSGNVFISGYANWNGLSGGGLLRMVP